MPYFQDALGLIVEVLLGFFLVAVILDNKEAPQSKIEAHLQKKQRIQVRLRIELQKWCAWMRGQCCFLASIASYPEL